MSITLPTLELPVYSLHLPIAKKTVEYTPFTVKQEKNLLISLLSEDEDNIFNTFKNVLNNCIKDNIKIEDLAITDMEFLFLNIRGKSVGELIELKYRCTNIIEGEEPRKCGHVVEFGVNVDDIKVEDSEYETNISIDSNIGVVMKPPTYKDFVNNSLKHTNQVDATFNNIVDCIDSIHDSENVYKAKDFTREEIVDFVDNMTDEMFNKINDNFFKKIPTIKHKLDFKCVSCGHEQDIVLESIKDFFM